MEAAIKIAGHGDFAPDIRFLFTGIALMGLGFFVSLGLAHCFFFSRDGDERYLKASILVFSTTCIGSLFVTFWPFISLSFATLAEGR